MSITLIPPSRHHQPGSPTCKVLAVVVGQWAGGLGEDLEDAEVPALGGQVRARVALAVREVDGRAARHEQLHHARLPGDHREVEGGLWGGGGVGEEGGEVGEEGEMVI